MLHKFPFALIGQLVFLLGSSASIPWLATARPISVGERAPHLFANPTLWIHLVAHLHVVRIMHDVLYHILKHRVPWEHWVHFRADVLRLERGMDVLIAT